MLFFFFFLKLRIFFFFFFSSRRRHTRSLCDWSSDVCSSDLEDADFEETAGQLVAHPFHDAIGALEAYRYPVIGQINGHAIGGGLELALTCDIRIAARGVKLGMPPAKLGLIYSHTGLLKFMQACGPANTA